MIRRILRFHAVGLAGIGVQLAAVWWFAAAGVHTVAATALAVEAAVIHNFLWHRRWTWRELDVPAAAAFVRFQLTNGLVSLAGNVVIVALLLRRFPLEAVAANAIAVAVCAAVNFLSADLFVFRSAR